MIQRLAYKTIFLLLLAFHFSCVPLKKEELNQEIMTSLGGEVKSGFEALADDFSSRVEAIPVILKPSWAWQKPV